MYSVNISRNFVRADGKPFRKQKEVKGRPVPVMEDGKPKIATDSAGRTVSFFETEEASYTDMLSMFLNNLFDLVTLKARENKEIKLLKLEDSTHATDIFRAIHVAKDTIELEKAPYEWLIKVLTDFGIDVFGVNTAVILEPIKKAQEVPANRAERRREEKAK